MTPLLSALNYFFLALSFGFIFTFVRRRLLSERSSLTCLAAVSGIFTFFKYAAGWNLFFGYQDRPALHHFLFIIFWGLAAVFIFAGVKLTEISRLRRTLVQDLALLNSGMEEDQKNETAGVSMKNMS